REERPEKERREREERRPLHPSSPYSRTYWANLRLISFAFFEISLKRSGVHSTAPFMIVLKGGAPSGASTSFRTLYMKPFLRSFWPSADKTKSANFDPPSGFGEFLISICTLGI